MPSKSQSKKVLKASKSDASTATAPETDDVREDSVVVVDERVDDATLDPTKYDLSKLPPCDDVISLVDRPKGVETKLETFKSVVHLELLVVPTFQRTFEWTKGDAAVLLNDIISGWWAQAKGADGSTSMTSKSLGTIILCKQDEADTTVLKTRPRYVNREKPCFVIIDGQQRITTLLCLLAAACNVAAYHVRKAIATLDGGDVEALKEQVSELFKLVDPLLKPDGTNFGQHQLFFVQEADHMGVNTTFEGPRSKFLLQRVFGHPQLSDLFGTPTATAAADPSAGGSGGGSIFEMDSNLFNSDKDAKTLAALCDSVCNTVSKDVDENMFPGARQYVRNATQVGLTLAWYLDATFYTGKAPNTVKWYRVDKKPLPELAARMFYLRYLVSYVCSSCHFCCESGSSEAVFDTFRGTNARGRFLKVSDTVRSEQLGIASKANVRVAASAGKDYTTMTSKVITFWHRVNGADELMAQLTGDERADAKAQQRNPTQFAMAPRRLLRPSEVILNVVRTCVEMLFRKKRDKATLEGILRRNLSAVQAEVSVIEDADDDTFYEALLREERFSGIIGGEKTEFARKASDLEMDGSSDRLDTLLCRYFEPAMALMQMLFAAGQDNPMEFLQLAFKWPHEYVVGNEPLARALVHLRTLILIANKRRGKVLDFFQDIAEATERGKEPKMLAFTMSVLALMPPPGVTERYPSGAALERMCNTLARQELLAMVAIVRWASASKDPRMSYKREDAIDWAVMEWKLLQHGESNGAIMADVTKKLVVAAQSIQERFAVLRNMASDDTSPNVRWVLFRLQCAQLNRELQGSDDCTAGPGARPCASGSGGLSIGADPSVGVGLQLLLQQHYRGLDVHHVRPRYLVKSGNTTEGWTADDDRLGESLGNLMLLDGDINGKIFVLPMSAGQKALLEDLNTPATRQVLAHTDEYNEWTPSSVRSRHMAMYRDLEFDLLRICGASLTRLSDAELEENFNAHLTTVPQAAVVTVSSGTKRKQRPTVVGKAASGTRRKRSAAESSYDIADDSDSDY